MLPYGNRKFSLGISGTSQKGAECSGPLLLLVTTTQVTKSLTRAWHPSASPMHAGARSLQHSNAQPMASLLSSGQGLTGNLIFPHPPGPSKAWLPIKKNKNPQSKARPFASPWCMFTHANQPGTVLPFFPGLQDSEYPLQPLGATCRGSSAGAPCACPVGGRFQLQPNASSNSTTSTPLPSVYFGWGFMVRGATRIGDISHLPGLRGPAVLFVIPSTHSSCFGHREGPDRRI